MIHVFSRTGAIGMAATFLLVAGSIALAPAASASTAASELCPSGSVCLYKDPDFQGAMFSDGGEHGLHAFQDDEGGDVFDDRSTLNDNASSIINNSDRQLDAFADVNFMGKKIVVGPRRTVRDLQASGLNDAISSFAFKRV